MIGALDVGWPLACRPLLDRPCLIHYHWPVFTRRRLVSCVCPFLIGAIGLLVLPLSMGGCRPHPVSLPSPLPPAEAGEWQAGPYQLLLTPHHTFTLSQDGVIQMGGTYDVSDRHITFQHDAQWAGQHCGLAGVYRMIINAKGMTLQRFLDDACENRVGLLERLWSKSGQ